MRKLMGGGYEGSPTIESTLTSPSRLPEQLQDQFSLLAELGPIIKEQLKTTA
jgi:hypothetical protein